MGTMNEQFDRQANVVASAWDVLGKPEWKTEWAAILDHFDLGFPFAHLHNAKLGTLNKEGKKQVTDTYDFLLKAMSLEDSDEFWSFWDLIDARNEVA